jgi:hypothetical protein
MGLRAARAAAPPRAGRLVGKKDANVYLDRPVAVAAQIAKLNSLAARRPDLRVEYTEERVPGDRGARLLFWRVTRRTP